MRALLCFVWRGRKSAAREEPHAYPDSSVQACIAYVHRPYSETWYADAPGYNRSKEGGKEAVGIAGEKIELAARGVMVGKQE